MLDLSFLTEEEQEAIMKVLQRDAELKRTEEERVRHLPEKIKDDVQLKNMSGQWFYEAKSKRHRDKIHGADIIRASMRRKPATLAEMSQNKSSKAMNSWVSNVNKEVFVPPPELHGIGEHQEEQLKFNSSSKTTTSLLAKPEETHTKTVVSKVKQRRNPFNSTVSDNDLNSEDSENRADTLPQLSKKEVLSVSEESQPKPHLQSDETEKHTKPSVEATDESQQGLIKRPVPKARKLIHKATGPVSQREEEVVPKPAKRTERINGTATPPRGILKRSSSSSSTDSEVRVSQMFDVQKKNGLPTATIFEGEAEKNSLIEEAEDSTQSSLEKLKQVRFSSSIGKAEPLQCPQVHYSRETGEFESLESDKGKSCGNDDTGSDSLGNKQISAVKPLGANSSALQIKPIDGLQEGTSTSGPCDTNRSGFLASETLQAKAATRKQLQTSQKISINILPSNNNELSGDETHQNQSNQTLSHGSKSHEHFTDEHQLSAKTEVHEVSNTSSTSLQQGKPDLVEDHNAKTTFKPDKNSDELVQVADESVSKVLDWFKRSSSTEDRKHSSVRSQDREPKDEMNISPTTAVSPAEHSEPSMDRKAEVTKELTCGKIKPQNSISPTFNSEDTQLTERMKAKKREENQEQNDKSLAESDYTRAKEVEHVPEIKQENKKSNLLEHQEHKLPVQKYESEKSMQERRRIKEIREFWERNKSVPSHKEREISINANVQGGDALKGLRDSEKIRPTGVYLPSGPGDQNKHTLRSSELSYTSQASKNEHQNSSELGPHHTAEKVERTVPSGGKVHEYTDLPKANNWQPRVDATLHFPDSKDEKEILKEKAAAHHQQKPNFQVLSLKEKMNEKSKNQISDPSQFQSLRNFWDTGVKLQNNINREALSLPNNANLITCEVKSKEDKGNNKLNKQEFIQQQNETPEREKTQKLDPVVYKLPQRSPTLNVTHTQNTDTVQLDRKPVTSKPQEKMGLSQQEVKDSTEKNTVSSVEHCASLQLLQSHAKDASKETAVGEWLCLPVKKVENRTSPLHVSLPKEEVAETVDKVVLPKADLDVFKLGLNKLEKEASETSSLNLKENILKETTFHSDQCGAFERTVEHSHDTSVEHKEELRKDTEKMEVPSTDEHANKSLRRLFREFKPFYLQHQAADRDDTLEGSRRPQAVLQNLLRETFTSQPSEYTRVGIKKSDYINSISQTNCTVESTCQEGTCQLEEFSETTEKSVAPSKVNDLNSALGKLVKEASETPPPEPKRLHSTTTRIAEVEFESKTYQHDGELPEEISESIEKSVAPSQVYDLSSALERLVKEASETPPPETKHADSIVWRPAEVEACSTAYEHHGELPQEITETIEKFVVPSKVSDLSSALEKLMKEASETKRGNSTAQRTAEMEVKSRTNQHDGELPQEITETIEKSVAPSKVSDLSSALEKLMKEASETPPPKPKRAHSTVQKIAEVEFESRTYQHDGELPQEITETVERSVAPSKVSDLSSALEKLMESFEMPPPKSKHADSTVQRTAEMKLKSKPYQHDGVLLQEISETIEKSVVSKAEGKMFDINLQKLLNEVSETPGSVLENTDEKPQGKMQTSGSMHAPHQQERDPPQEIEETIEKNSVSNIAELSEFSSSLEALLQEAFEEQNSNTAIHNLTVSEIKASDLPKRNGAVNKIEKRNVAPTDHLPFKGEANRTAIKPFEINDKGRGGESTSLDVSEIHSEFKALLKCRRASTPIKDESNSLQPKGDQICLILEHEGNDEEEGHGSNSGSKFSDENSESFSGTGSSTRSEEQLNPVLMALKRSADRKMPSKSLEDIPSATSNKGKINNPKEELALSAEDVSTVPSQPDELFSHPDKLKGLSKSVPSFLQEESDDRQTDTASESSYSIGRIKKSPSSLTNLSSSSGMASLSSVSGSLMSIYSADFGNVDVKGNIQFAIDYVEQLNELHIFICQCKGLAVADVKRQRSDPYVKTYLLPEKYRLGKRKTSVKKKTFNPVYNEILRYKIEKDLLKNQSLNISVWHNDTFGRNSFLGEVELDLGTWDWNDKSNKQINWFPLQPRTSAMALTLENRGEMKLALQYVPHPVGGKKTLSTGEVHIWVKECHNLPLLRGNRLNSFIKCTILPDTSRKSRQKTRTVSKTANPVFNHTMVYDGFRPEDLKEACVELTVWDHNKLANHFLGGLRIGLGTGKSYGTTVDWMDSTSDETALWEKMMKSPNRWVEDTLPLRMLMVAKLTK